MATGESWCIYRFKDYSWSADVEPGCLALAVAGIPFEEVRLDRSPEEWGKMKDTLGCPYDQLPILKMPASGSSTSSCVLAQSNAINRACGLKSGLMPSEDPLRFAKIDEILCAIQDVKQKFIPSMLIKDVEKKRAVRQRLMANVVTPWLRSLEALLGKNTSYFGQSFCVGPSLSIADLALDCLMAWLESGSLIGVEPGVLPPAEDLPLIVAVRRSVEADPAVRARRDEQPDVRRDESGWRMQKVYTASITAKIMSSADAHMDEIFDTFSKWDTEGEGFISRADLASVLSKLDVFSPEEVDIVMTWADQTGDGKINYRDFVKRLAVEEGSEKGTDTI